MEPLDFLTAVLPSTGKYCSFALKGKRNTFADTPQEIFDNAKQISDAGGEVWFALGSFDDSGYRKAENALFMRSFFMDLDCGKDVKTGEMRSFPSKRSAAEALAEFLVASGLDALGRPWLVDSGGGVHPYWPLSEDVTIAEWKPVAEAMKVAAFKHHFPIDTTVTADAARVLRVPGTHNNKSTPRPVRIVETGGTFDFAAIKVALAPYAVKNPVHPVQSTSLAIPGIALDSPPSPLAIALAGNSITRFRTIMLRTEKGTGCGQLANYIEHAADDGMEPIWRGMLSWTKYCIDGDKASKILSEMHPYDDERRLEKLDAIKGPYSCASMNTIQQGICEKCRHWGQITNPLGLSREFATTTETVEITPPQADAPTFYRPKAPRGFDYMPTGGIVYHKPAGPGKNDFAKDVALLTYDLFRTRTFRDGTLYTSEFLAIKGDKQITFVIPNSIAGNTPKIIETLAANNILTTYGSGTDLYLAAYVRACITEASINEETVNIPPHFGWQEDGSFAVGDMVYSPHGAKHDYAYQSDRLHNLIQATRTSGSLDEWKQLLIMLRRRKAWGHLAISLQGFSSILMHFMPKGSKACTVYVCGKQSSAGKTLALSLASSVWGDHERYKVSADTSQTTMMQRAGLWGNLPLNVDEITDRQRKEKGEFVPSVSFSHSQCVHKIKGSAGGNTEISHEMMWSAKMLMTGNDPAFESLLGARSHTSHGEVRRLLEWHITGNSRINWSDEEREILRKTADNYGVAGRAFAMWCVRNQDIVQDICNKAAQYWREFSGATDDERFWTSSIGCDLATLLLLGKDYANIIAIPTGGIKEFWLKIVTDQRKMILDNTSTAIDLLHRYIADNNGSFVKVKAGIITQSLIDFGKLTPDSPKGAVRGRVEYDTATETANFYVEEKLLRKHCAEAGLGYTSFLAELSVQATVIVDKRKDLLAGTNGPSMRVKCVQIVQPLASVNDEE